MRFRFRIGSDIWLSKIVTLPSRRETDLSHLRAGAVIYLQANVAFIVLEMIGFEPTTYGLQSRRSPN
jgi:hypothetical protein